jgi:putative ATP-dependent endonuclease of the OLD family
MTDYTCLVGPNGVGKSAVFAALNVFFGQAVPPATNAGELSEEDFHQRQISEPIRITLTFGHLSASAKADLAHYVRQEQLVVFVEADWNPEKQTALVVQHGLRRGIAAFASYFQKDAVGAKVSDLKGTYEEIRKSFGDLPEPGTKAVMSAALREYEATHAALCVDIPSQAQFYGVGGKGLLDKHVQWVHVPAVKDAAGEGIEARNTWLGQLVQRAVRSKVKFEDQLDAIRVDALDKYRALLEERQDTLTTLSESLTQRMEDWSHTGGSLQLRWESDPGRSVSVQAPYVGLQAGDSGFAGHLSRQGHGFQRLYLLTLLRELAASNESNVPTLLLACEEPELYQHPPQARHLAWALNALSEVGAQVLVCTHSPYFVSGKGFPDIRIVSRKPGGKDSAVRYTTFEQVAEVLQKAGGNAPRNAEGARVKLNQLLQPGVNEMLFAPVLVLVEGLEDAAFIMSYLVLSGRADEFRRFGCHIVPAEGKSRVAELRAVANCLDIPTYTVFDADRDKCFPAPGAGQNEIDRCNSDRPKHEKDNKALFALCGGPEAGPFPTSIVWQPNLTAWSTEIGDVVRTEVGRDVYQEAEAHVRHAEHFSEGSLGKNQLFIGLVLEKLWNDGVRCASLERLCEAILAHAKSSRAVPGKSGSSL